MSNIKTTIELSRDLEALSNNPHFQSVVEFLKQRSTILAYEACGETDPTKMRWVQGRVQELSDLLNQIGDARENLEAFKKPQPDVSGVL